MHECAECTTTLEPWEGQPAPRLYGFTAKQIATALVAVAGGSSYRAAAAAVRSSAGRELRTVRRVGSSGKTLPAPNEHGQLVSDWVQVFTPMIWQAYAPSSWPQLLVLDEDEFRFASAGSARGKLAFVVLAAVGYLPSGKPFVAAIEAVPRVNVPAWRAFLSRLSGTPTRVVTDGGLARKAAQRVWPEPDQPAPQLWRCEWHLARNITTSLPDNVQRDPTDEIHPLIAAAQTSPAGWTALLAHVSRRAAPGGYHATTKTVTSLDELVRRQTAARANTGPYSSGAVEQFFRHLDATLGDRAARLTNKARADALLQLLAAHRNGWANQQAWADLIRENLLTRQGRAPQQRQCSNPAHPSSLRTPRPAPAIVDF